MQHLEEHFPVRIAEKQKPKEREIENFLMIRQHFHLSKCHPMLLNLPKL